MTHTYALLPISRVAYEEVRDALRGIGGYDHALLDGCIDMHGLGLEPKDQIDGEDD